ncbi:MAG: hypothetical protein AW07_04169 [Candidatus Accumulibacter sp. SK-11]|nr:MAG: hypothetical protein AW07_04169 [Candidatus Accumulibacter sp. SK-11]
MPAVDRVGEADRIGTTQRARRHPENPARRQPAAVAELVSGRDHDLLHRAADELAVDRQRACRCLRGERVALGGRDELAEIPLQQPGRRRRGIERWPVAQVGPERAAVIADREAGEVGTGDGRSGTKVLGPRTERVADDADLATQPPGAACGLSVAVQRVEEIEEVVGNQRVLLASTRLDQHR